MSKNTVNERLPVDWGALSDERPVDKEPEAAGELHSIVRDPRPYPSELESLTRGEIEIVTDPVTDSDWKTDAIEPEQAAAPTPEATAQGPLGSAAATPAAFGLAGPESPQMQLTVDPVAAEPPVRQSDAGADEFAEAPVPEMGGPGVQDAPVPHLDADAGTAPEADIYYMPDVPEDVGVLPAQDEAQDIDAAPDEPAEAPAPEMAAPEAPATPEVPVEQPDAVVEPALEADVPDVTDPAPEPAEPLPVEDEAHVADAAPDVLAEVPAPEPGEPVEAAPEIEAPELQPDAAEPMDALAEQPGPETVEIVEAPAAEVIAPQPAEETPVEAPVPAEAETAAPAIVPDAAVPAVATNRNLSIEVENLVLRYPVGPYRRGSLKASVLGLFGHKELNAQIEYVTAIRGVSLQIHHGERVGVIGRNGSGKSSLLRVLAGVFPIESGSVRVNGEIGSLLDISLGFETESTGRENIYNRGYAMGRTRKELQAAEAEIVALADLGDFIDLPMRTYSAGMFVRLGFAISTQFTPDVLLVDEVFGAGDATFARRAQRRMRQLTANAGVLVMVSHDFSAILENCTRVIWMDRGRIAFDGDAHEGVTRYLEASADGALE